MRLILSFLLLMSFSAFGQLVDVGFYLNDAPGNAGFVGDQRRVSLEVLNDGSMFYFNIDNTNNTLYAHKYWMQPASFNQMAAASTIGNNNELSTYQINNRIYCLVAGEDLVGAGRYHLYLFDPSDFSLTLLHSLTTGINVFNTGISFVINQAENLIFTLGYDFNSGPTVEKFDIATGAWLETVMTPGMGAGISSMVLDEQASILYVVFRSLFGSYPVTYYSFTNQANLSFQALEPNGQITLPGFYTGAANTSGPGFFLSKPGTGPDIVYTHNGGSGNQTFKKALGSGTSAQTNPANPFVLEYASGNGSSSSFAFGTMDASNLRVVEFMENGSVNYVANNTIPDIYSGGGQQLKIASSPNGQRVAGFFQFQGPMTTTGNFFFSDRGPEVVSYNKNDLCSNGGGNMIENLTFSDPEMDMVYITSVTSSNQSVIQDVNIFFSDNGFGVWEIYGWPEGVGTTTITVTFTDGASFSNFTETIQVIPVTNPSFTSAQLEFCQNQGEVDFSEYLLGSTGGTWSIDEENYDYDELIDLSQYENGNQPYFSYIYYFGIDGNGCFISANADMIIYPSPGVEISNVVSTSCGATTGQLTATVDSPNGPFVSYWSNGVHNANSISNLSAGAYFINVIDELGCFAMAQGNVTVSDVTVTPSIQEVSCHNGSNGSISLAVSGPNAPYSILWSNGFSVFSISNLSAGAYSAVITDVNGCQSTHTYVLENPLKFEAYPYWFSPGCGLNDGIMELDFTINEVGNVSVVWQDIVNGGVFSTNTQANNVPAGLYNMVATDGNGCQATSIVELNSFDAAYVTNSTIVRPECGINNGSIAIQVFSPTNSAINSIQWSNGQTGNTASNLASGSYHCIITQADGCQSFFNWSVGSPRPARPEICMVTVDTTTTTNLVVWEKPANQGSLDYYTIYRETAIPGQYLPIWSMDYDLISVFNDVVASPKVHSWRYRISVTDECGVESSLSLPHKTIYLTYNEISSNEYRVVWDNYQGFAFTNYDLLRYTDTQGWEVVAPNMSIMQLPEYIDQNVPAHTVIDYMVEITPPGGLCSATEFKAQDYNSSRSNKARGEFNPGDGTGDPNNNVIEFDNGTFSAMIYPNPNNGLFTIEIQFSSNEEQLSLDIFDVQGKFIHNALIGQGQTSIDLQGVKSGMYFVRLVSNSTSELIKIIKE
jgi:hypothetical protein